nr:hypothetical protein StreXyl84_76530 [Streptomyces sp. Xyl84]
MITDCRLARDRGAMSVCTGRAEGPQGYGDEGQAQTPKPAGTASHMLIESDVRT